MQFHPNELFIYYNPESNTGKQCRAYAKSISNNVNDVNCTRIRLTTTLWKEIIDMLGLRPKDLLDRSKTEYQEKIAGRNLTMTGWLEVLIKNPELLKAPIAIYNSKAVLCQKPTDILKLDLNSRSSSRVPPHLTYRKQTSN